VSGSYILLLGHELWFDNLKGASVAGFDEDDLAALRADDIPQLALLEGIGDGRNEKAVGTRDGIEQHVLLLRESCPERPARGSKGIRSTFVVSVPRGANLG
jgi:hypothetical protein